MLVPAEQVPVSLIGRIWNLSSRWSPPDEDGCVEEKRAEACCSIGDTLMEGYKYRDMHAAVMYMQRLGREHTHIHTHTHTRCSNWHLHEQF